MKSFVFSLLLTLLTTAMTSQALEVEASDALPSPYFIDELHCSGINVPDVMEGWLLSSEEVEPARTVEQAEICERTLRVFGIEKFSWLSPDDLERTATVIRQSGYFQEADLSIRKSELKNHVHIFLKVKPIRRFSEDFGDDFKFFAAKNQNSSLLYNKLSGELTDHKYGPIVSNTFGFSVQGTSTSSPINVDPSLVTGDDLVKFQMHREQLADLYWKQQGQFTKYLSYDWGAHLTDDNVYSDGHSRLNFVGDGDILATKHINIVNGKVFLGPAFIVTTFTPYQIAASTGSRGVFMPGFVVGYDYGQAFGNNLKFKLGYYNASTDHSVFQMNFDLQRHIHLFNSFIVAGFDDRFVKDAVLPQDRFPLSGATDIDSHIGLAKVFHGAESTQQISVLFGSEQLTYNNQPPNYQASADYVGLRYKILDGTWSVNLAASYYFNRLY